MPENVTSAIGAAAAVGFGGFFGAIARWGTSLAAGAIAGTAFPWGTLVANWVGCLLIGVLKTSLDRSATVPPALTLAVVTGFLGAYTTFSAFSLDTLSVARNLGSKTAAVYVGASVVGGIALCLLGVRLSGGLR